MCLAIPGKIVELRKEGRIALVDYGSEKREANNMLTNAKVGEWVLVQQKAVVEVIAEEEIPDVINAWNEAKNGN